MAIPGVLWGPYPERDTRETPSAASRWIAHALQPGDRAQQRSCHALVTAVRKVQAVVAGESDERLQVRLQSLRAQLARDGFAGDALAETFAVVAVVCRRVLGVELFDTQLFAARVMLDGQLAEMATGEGKTLAAAVTAGTAALAGMPVHVLTANDYLVARDASTLRPLYEALGLTVGAVTQSMPAAARREAYACDITYCTAKELVFDYLRDRVAAPRSSPLEQRAAALSGVAPAQRLLRGLCMAVVDEADSILIDEARVPLVLSQALADEAQGHLQHAWNLSAALEAQTHFAVDPRGRRAQLTAAGREALLAMTDSGVFPWLNTRHRDDMISLALTARCVLQRGRDYVVETGKVHIVDETTGRKATGRSWSQGLHQLVEIKEGLAPSAPVATLAQITYQCFFPRYLRLCGMSGTLIEARAELRQMYDLKVTKVPLRQPSRRRVQALHLFDDADAQWAAVVARARELRAQGRPLLVGTDSVLDSEALSQHLSAAGLAHAVLNAHQDQQEAAIVAAAGRAGAITIATNMAGRGTDILLTDDSRAAGGLHIICCQQNASRRIDRQLIGRCARQGDPGSVERYVSLRGPMLASQSILRYVKNMIKNKYLRTNGLGAWALARAQGAAERRDRRAREALKRRDQHMNDWFAFSGGER